MISWHEYIFTGYNKSINEYQGYWFTSLFHPNVCPDVKVSLSLSLLATFLQRASRYSKIIRFYSYPRKEAVLKSITPVVRHLCFLPEGKRLHRCCPGGKGFEAVVLALLRHCLPAMSSREGKGNQFCSDFR